MMRTLYETIGYQCVEISAATGEGVDELRPLIRDKKSLLSGNSGVGKSTLINQLIPDAGQRTAEISEAHNSGMHTTTFSEMLELPEGGYLIDTPGIKGFGTFDIEKEELTSYFKEIFKFSQNCKFSDCTHTHEPGCAVIKAVEEHYIAASRYQSYLSMLEDKDEISIVRHSRNHGFRSGYKIRIMAKQELKDFKQRVEEGEFAQSAEISASYLDEDILIIDNVKVLQNPDPVRLQMNMIASCLRGSLKVEYNGNILLVEKGDIFICPPNSTLDIVEVSGDFACTAMCVSNHGMLNILRSHISVWNRAMYVSKVSVLKMNELDMVFYAKFTDLVRLCLDPSFSERTSWKPYRREIVETLLKSALLAVSNMLLEDMPKEELNSSSSELFDQFLELLQQAEVKHQPVENFARKLCITPKYLSIICKRHSGKTAIEWITEYTLADITYLLRSTSKTIKEISGILGFSNTSFFGKYVREHLHMSPLKYRESLRKK